MAQLTGNRACTGGLTDAVRKCGEHGQRCRRCGTWVRDDMVDHWLFGFRAHCPELYRLSKQACSPAHEER